MNDYLNPGFKFLFQGRRKEAHLTVASKFPENSTTEILPVVSKTIATLKEKVGANFNLTNVRKPLMDQFTDAIQKANGLQEATVYGSFSEFLDVELESEDYIS
jgi:hypothetical protein